MTLIVDADAVKIRSVSVAPMDNNVYLLTSTKTGEQVLIDAANDPSAILRLMDESAHDGPNARLSVIVTTHEHSDHIQALAEIWRETGARTACGADDAAQIQAGTGVPADLRLEDGSMVKVGGITLAVIALRGHTPGSIALAYTEEGRPAQIFTGDSMFPGGVGNTEGDQARFESLLTDVERRIFDVYPDDTVIWPGHGSSTTLGAERPHLREWWDRGW
ncbi:MAG: MBL fold metallo-hydrolase [Propionibacteriaceae bacterium]|nr:MBL fold metallo-hydrolase [Propionibacteriaceae bacterium]